MMIRQTMKLMLLGGTLIIGAQTAQAQTCANQPTCSELGYTLTSTSACIGAVLKCPFDKTKYYCTQKSEVLSNMQLDWSNRATINVPGYYYPSKYGCLFGVLVSNSTSVQISINGVNQSFTNKENEFMPVFLCIGPSDRIYIQSISTVRIDFVPYKGN